MNKNDLRFIKTEKLIKDAFIDLLDESGVKGVSVRALCEKALISRNTFYMHYETISNLVESIYVDVWRDFGKNYELTKAENTSVEQGIRWYIDQVDSHRHTIRALFRYDMRNFDKIVYDYVFRQPMMLVYDDFDSYTTDVRVQLNIGFILSAVITYTVTWLDNYDRISKELRVKDMAELLRMPLKLFRDKLHQVMERDKNKRD